MTKKLTIKSDPTLRAAVEAMEEKHGGCRAAARALGVSAPYLMRLRTGMQKNPSAVILRKLKLRRIVSVRYESIP